MPSAFTKIIYGNIMQFFRWEAGTHSIAHYTGQQFELETGVPQGSCLSPTLYTVFTNDMPDTPYDKKIIYADDVTQRVRYPGSSKEIFRRRTIKALEAVSKYERQLKIKTSTKKFEIISISKKKPPDITIEVLQLILLSLACCLVWNCRLPHSHNL